MAQRFYSQVHVLPGNGHLLHESCVPMPRVNDSWQRSNPSLDQIACSPLSGSARVFTSHRTSIRVHLDAAGWREGVNQIEDNRRPAGTAKSARN